MKCVKLERRASSHAMVKLLWLAGLLVAVEQVGRQWKRAGTPLGSTAKSYFYHILHHNLSLFILFCIILSHILSLFYHILSIYLILIIISSLNMSYD